jgi:hypothetical protein
LVLVDAVSTDISSGNEATDAPFASCTSRQVESSNTSQADENVGGSNVQASQDVAPRIHSISQVNELLATGQLDDIERILQSLKEGQQKVTKTSKDSLVPRGSLTLDQSLDREPDGVDPDENEQVPLKVPRYSEDIKDKRHEDAIIALTQKHTEETAALKEQFDKAKEGSKMSIRHWQRVRQHATASLQLEKNRNDSLQKRIQDLNVHLACAVEKSRDDSAKFTAAGSRRAELEDDFNTCVITVLERTREYDMQRARREAEEAHKHTLKFHQEKQDQDRDTIKMLQRRLEEKVAAIKPSELELKLRQQTQESFESKQQVRDYQKEIKNLTMERDAHHEKLLKADEDYEATRTAQLEAESQVEKMQDTYEENE